MTESIFENWCVLVNRKVHTPYPGTELPCQWHREPWESYARHGEGAGDWYLLISGVPAKESYTIHAMLSALDVRKYTNDDLMKLYKYRMRAAFDAIAELAELSPEIGADPEKIKQLKEKFSKAR